MKKIIHTQFTRNTSLQSDIQKCKPLADKLRAKYGDERFKQIAPSYDQPTPAPAPEVTK